MKQLIKSANITINTRTRTAAIDAEPSSREWNMESDAIRRREEMRPFSVVDKLVVMMQDIGPSSTPTAFVEGDLTKQLTMADIDAQLDEMEDTARIDVTEVTVTGGEPLLQSWKLADILSHMRARLGYFHVTIKTGLAFDNWTYAESVGNVKAIAQEFSERPTIEVKIGLGGPAENGVMMNRVTELSACSLLDVVAVSYVDSNTIGEKLFNDASALRRLTKSARLKAALDISPGKEPSLEAIESVINNLKALQRIMKVSTDVGERVRMLEPGSVKRIEGSSELRVADDAAGHCGAYAGTRAITTDGVKPCELIAYASAPQRSDAYVARLGAGPKCAACDVLGVCKGGCAARVMNPQGEPAYCAWTKGCIELALNEFALRSDDPGASLLEIAESYAD